MEQHEIIEEYFSKYDPVCGRLNDKLSDEAYEWARNNSDLINELSNQFIKVELGKCYESIVELIKKYMDMPEEQVKMVAVWIIGTYFHNNFDTYPFLFLNAMRGSGKTRLLKIIAHLSKRGLGQVQTGITESVLFRLPKGNTLVLDEIESIGSKEKQTLREYMNACYKKGGVVQRLKKVKSKEGEQFVPDTFEPFKPIAMANIWGMDEVLGDRCITIVLEKSNNPAKTKLMEDFDTNPEFSELKVRLTRFSDVSAVSAGKRTYKKSWNDYIISKYTINNITSYTSYTSYTTLTTLKKRKMIQEENDYEEMFNKIDGLNITGRNLELLFPLLIVSKEISNWVFEDILLIGKELMEIKKQDEFAESREVSVYDFIARMEQTLQFISMRDIVAKFRIFYGEEDWLNEKWLGRALKRLNLIVDKKKMASGMFFILNVAKAKEKIKIFRDTKGVEK